MDQSSRTYLGLMRLRDRGFLPSAILDIGAHVGGWARGARAIFPTAYIFMVEALAEKEEALRIACRDIGNADCVISLLGSQDAQDVEFFVVHAGQDQSGSSKFRENTRFPTEQRRVEQATLDSLLSATERAFPFIKLDVQGAELDILAGATRTLARTEVILMEVATLQYNQGAPLVAEVLSTMKDLGFVLYDFLDEHRRDDNTVLCQFDALFVRADWPLRPQPPF